MPQAVELHQMLEARERRAQRQQALLKAHGLPLVSFSMNIAGPIKNSPLIRRGFALGRAQLFAHLRAAGARIAAQEEKDEVTGCEGLYVISFPPQDIKKITCAIEEDTPLGRLLDLDVIAPSGEKLERSLPRPCLICGLPARECARSRIHSVEALQKAARILLQDAVNVQDAHDAARLATQALLYEVCTTPKPGLVDRQHNGSHSDMNIYTFMASAAALTPYFQQCVLTGRKTAHRPGPDTLAALRPAGILAEDAMRQATGNVNTHKGAIYSMGLLCGAMGRLEREKWAIPEAVLRMVAAMAQGEVLRARQGASPLDPPTAGQRIYQAHGIAGVRGEAEKGFPTVLSYGLPVLEQGLAREKTMDEAGAAALLHLLAHTDDTNMMARGGLERQLQVQAQLKELLSRSPFPSQEEIASLDRAFVHQRLSPGGSADLLALCYMLHFLKKEGA